MEEPTLTDVQIAERVRYHVQRFHLSAADILQEPEFFHAVERLRSGDSSAAEWAISYLALRPYHYRSGYLRNEFLRHLRKVQLHEGQKRRLREFIVDSIDRQDRLDRKELSALARRLDTELFRAKLGDLAASNSPAALVAAHVLGRCQMNDYREDLRGAR